MRRLTSDDWKGRSMIESGESPDSSMDLREALRQLHEEKKRIENVIASLEALLGNDARAPRPAAERAKRGRKSMSPEERQRVSERMKKYWASRRPE
jgi:hypothetical protein